MDQEKILSYHETICNEIKSKEGLMATLISHNLSIGTYRENVLRNALRARLPQNYSIGKGFVVTDSGSSSEIDILIYDSMFPVLFREDEFVVVTPDAVKCIIEVKSTASTKDVQESIRKLSYNSEFIRSALVDKEIFSGLFVFSNKINNLNTLKEKIILGLLGFPYDRKCEEFKCISNKIKTIDVKEHLKNRDINAICICSSNSGLYKEQEGESTKDGDNSDGKFNEIIMTIKEGKSWDMTEIDEKYEEAIFINDIIGFLCPKTFKDNNSIWNILDNISSINQKDLGTFDYEDEIELLIKEYIKSKSKKEFCNYVDFKNKSSKKSENNCV